MARRQSAGVWLSVALAFTVLGLGMGYVVAVATTPNQNAAVAELQRQVAVMERKLKTPARQEQAARQRPVEQQVVNQSRIADRIVDAIAAPDIEVLSATAVQQMAWNSRNPYIYLELTAMVKNFSGKPIATQRFYVRRSLENRTVPVGDVVKTVEIRGGIEPGETKSVKINLFLSELDIDDVFDLQELPNGTFLEVSVVHPRNFTRDKDYYEMFADLKRVLVKYRHVTQQDPAMEAFRNL